MNKADNKGHLVFRERQTLRNGLLRDGVIWKIPESDRYPEGVRYRLALIDVASKQILELFDNHYPKGPHRHLPNGTEENYAFESVEQLITDYLASVLQEVEKRENKEI